MPFSYAATAQLWETFCTRGGAELIRDAVELVLQEVIEAEAIGAARHERNAGRTTERNGHTGRGSKLKIPKLRWGSFFPSVLESRRRIDRALWAFIMVPLCVKSAGSTWR